MTASLFIQFFLLILGCYFLSYQVMHGLARVSRKYIVLRLILLPGIMLHELAHATACFLTGTPIESISFWDEAGGSVVHHKPKLSFITQPIISIAPFPIGIASLLTLSHFLAAVAWGYALILLFLMISIAGTLAPSKTDLVHAIEGSLVMSAISIALLVTFPSLLAKLSPTIHTFNKEMLIVDGMLGGLWIVLVLFQNIVSYRR